MKLLPLLAIMVMLTSCKKEYTCDCYQKNGTQRFYSNVFTATKNQKYQIDKKCSDLEYWSRVNQFDTTIFCTLK